MKPANSIHAPIVMLRHGVFLKASRQVHARPISGLLVSDTSALGNEYSRNQGGLAIARGRGEQRSPSARASVGAGVQFTLGSFFEFRFWIDNQNN